MSHHHLPRLLDVGVDHIQDGSLASSCAIDDHTGAGAPSAAPAPIGLGDRQRVTAQVAGEQTATLGQGAGVRGG
ncbi:hypothetical protein [Nonomuraea bangladeshensis]|uniref:hypothetical protein n=1 Tax=Nonomuraea bangladeshensis TaxID=404385 RepID=UPI0031E37719